MPSAARTADCAPSATTRRRASPRSPASVVNRMRVRARLNRSDARMDEADPGRGGNPLVQRPAEQPVLDRVAERRDTLLLGGQDGRAEAAALGLRGCGGSVSPGSRISGPGADAPRAPAGCRSTARSYANQNSAAPRTPAAPARSRPRRAAARERRREREADHAAAGDRRRRSGRASGALMQPPSGARSRPGPSACPPSVPSGSPSVTTTSSSMRTPMPLHSRRTPFAPARCRCRARSS